MQPLCLVCDHMNRLQPGEGWTCIACPDGIPAAIFDGQTDHYQHRKNDHGLRFHCEGDRDTPAYWQRVRDTLGQWVDEQAHWARISTLRAGESPPVG